MNHHRQISFFKFLFEFTDHLMYQFNKIQICHFQCNIAGTGFRCFYNILSQYFKSLCLVFQHFQISPDLRIFRIFTLQKIYIIDD